MTSKQIAWSQYKRLKKNNDQILDMLNQRFEYARENKNTNLMTEIVEIEKQIKHITGGK